MEGKTALQSKTIKINSVIAALTAVLTAIPEVQPFLTGKAALYAATVVSVLNIVLRFLTTQPIVKSQ